MSQVVQQDSHIIAHITMTLSDGSAADSTKVNNKPAKIILGNQTLSPAFEQQLFGMHAGESKTFTLASVDAFGEKNPDNVHFVDKSRFTEEIPAKIGNIITFTQPGGIELPGMVTEVLGDSVTVDFNHPLAGQAITFTIDIVSIES